MDRTIPVELIRTVDEYLHKGEILDPFRYIKPGQGEARLLSVPLVHQAINLSAQSLATPKLVLVDGVSGKVYRDSTHHDINQQLVHAVRDMHVYGVGYLLPSLVIKGNNVMFGLEWVPFSDVEPQVKHRKNEGDKVVAFKIHGKTYKPEDVIMIYNTLIGGVQPLATLAVAKEAGEAAIHLSTWIRAFFANGGVPLVMLVAERSIGPEEESRLKRLWERMLTSAKRMFSVMVVRQGIRVETLSPPVKDMDVSALDHYIRNQIASAFNIPPQLLGEEASQASYRFASRTFFRQHVLPLIQLVEASINRVLYPKYGYYVQFDITSVPEALSDLAGKADAVAKLVASGAIRPEDGVNLIGLDQDIYGLTPGSPGESTVPDIKNLPKQRDEDLQELHTPIEKAKILSEIVSEIATITKAKVRALWDREADDIIADFEASGKKYLERSFRSLLRSSEDGAKNLDDDFTVDDLVDVISGKFEKVMHTYFDRYVLPIIYYMFFVYGQNTVPTETPVEDALQLLSQRKQFHIARTVETTRKGLAAAVQHAAESGEFDPTAFITAIMPLFDKHRVDLITDTTITDAISSTADYYELFLRNIGVEYEVYWHTARDERVCPICRPMDGKPKSEWGTLTIPAHPGCRCWPDIRLKKR